LSSCDGTRHHQGSRQKKVCEPLVEEQLKTRFILLGEDETLCGERTRLEEL